MFIVKTSQNILWYRKTISYFLVYVGLYVIQMALYVYCCYFYIHTRHIEVAAVQQYTHIYCCVYIHTYRSSSSRHHHTDVIVCVLKSCMEVAALATIIQVWQRWSACKKCDTSYRHANCNYNIRESYYMYYGPDKDEALAKGFRV